MKNISKTLLFAAFVAFAFSCEKVENPAPINTIDETRTATIKGLLLAETNTTNGDLEHPPAGTKVFIEIDSREYATSTFRGTYQPLLFEATTDANGEFEVQVPALAKSIEADVRGDDFVFDQTIRDPDDFDKTITRKRLFYRASDDVDFTEKKTSFVKIFYNDTSYE